MTEGFKVVFKKLLSIIISGALIALGFSGIVSATGRTNLLSNPNASIADANGQPTDYYSDSWGDNQTTFRYLADSDEYPTLRTTVSSYNDGDAKWYHAQTTVTNHTYTYSDLYKSSVATNYWARYVDNSGNVTYGWLGQVNPADAWTKGQVSFTPAVNIVSVSLFHVINTNGYLDTAQFSLYDNNEDGCVATDVNGVVNGSFEQNCKDYTLPLGWKSGTYGNITANYATSSVAHVGDFSAKINVTEAPGGEAGIISSPIVVAPSQKVNVSFWQQSTTYLYVYAEITTTAGLQYASLTSMPASIGSWSQYNDSFIAPTDATSFVLHIATSAIGDIFIDDVAVVISVPTVSQFTSPMISIDFDDGSFGTYKYGVPIMSALGLKGTYYLNGSVLDTKNYMTTAQIKNLVKTGNEIGSHGYYHTDSVTIDPLTYAQQTLQNKTLLQKISSQKINSFAVPFGSYDDSIVNVVTQHHDNLRDTSGALNYAYSFDTYHIHGKVVTSDMTTSYIQSLIQKTSDNHAWLILVFHDVSNTASSDPYTLTTSALRSILTQIKNSGIKVATTQQALDLISNR